MSLTEKVGFILATILGVGGGMFFFSLFLNSFQIYQGCDISQGPPLPTLLALGAMGCFGVWLFFSCRDEEVEE